MADRRGSASGRIVGREAELATLLDFVDSDDVRGLVLRGGPGVGKTTLWRAGIEAARERGVQVLSAAPGENETKLSLAAVADLLDEIDDAHLRRLPTPQARALEVALLRADPGKRPLEPRAVAAAFLGALRELARDGPVLVAVDDIQWLDPSSAAAIEFAARRLDAGAFLLSQRAGTTSQLDRVFEEADWTRLDVAGLSLGAVRRLLLEQLGLRLPRWTLRRLYAATAGNPLFTLEVGRVLAQSGVPGADEPLPVPVDLHAAVVDRVSQLPGTTRSLLLAAALLARPQAETLRALDPELESALEPAERAGIAGLEQGLVVFAHPLHAAAVVASATAAERRRMHRRLAESAPDPEERARHLALGVEGRDETVATTVLAAARATFMRGAAPAAAELAELALDLGMPAGDDTPARKLAVAGYLRWAGDPARARDVLEAVDDWPAWAPALRARALGQLLSAVYWTDGATAACELGERMLAETLPDAVAAEVHAFLSGSYEVDFDRASEHGDAALALLERLGADADPATLARALTYRVRNRLVLGLGFERHLFERVVALEDLLAEAGRPDERVSTNFANWFKHFDDLDASRAMLQERHTEAVAVNDEFAQVASLMHLGLTECWAGRLHLARDHLDAAGRIIEELGARNVGVVGMSALVEAHLGDADAVRALVAQAVAEEGELSGREAYEIFLGAGAGLLELSLGDAGAADRHLGLVLDGLDAGRIREPGIFRVHANAAEAALGVGDVERAERIGTTLLEHADTTGHRWSRAVGERVRALVSAERGDLDAAAASAEAALAAHDGLPMPFERARTLLVHGVIERRANRRGRARQALEEAASEFERIGASLWEQRAQEELARIPGRQPRTGNGLTPTEERVAGLAAKGLSNKEIASALFVTVNTVEVHLSHAYAKLGVRSRSQLAGRLDALS